MSYSFGKIADACKVPNKGLLGFLLILMFQVSAGAQTGAEYSVLWIGQFPGEAGKKAPDFGDRLSRLVFGKKPREVIKPFNVVADNPGHYWILDQGAGGVFEVLEGEGELIRSMKRAKQDFPSLVGICGTPAGGLFFTDSRLNQVMQVEDGDVSVFAGTLSFQQPTGIAFNRLSGEIWVVETGAHQISVLNTAGERIRTIGGRGTAPGKFNYPTFIWIDAKGRVFVVDSMNFRVQILNARGQVESFFGELGDATGNMARPKGVATDSQGHIYVADALFHAVQIFDDQGNLLYSFGSQGQGAGEFWMPSGIYIDEQDHIYVADSYNARVQVFQLVKNSL
jgi:sugar lactone lactonase YvrE